MLLSLLFAFSLVEGGQAKSCIVLPEVPTRHERFVASELQHWTHELTGARLPICSDAPKGFKSIRFKTCSDSEISEEGFKISATDDSLVIKSRRPFPLTCALYWLLNRFGGIYWCDPESGADFKKLSDFSIPDGEYLRNPMPKRQPLVPGLPGPEVTRKVTEWNVHNGFRPNIDVSSDYALDIGLEPLLHIGGSLGDRIWMAETNETEIAAEIERLKKTGEDLTRCKDRKPATLRKVAQTFLQMRKHPERFPLINGKRCPTGTDFRWGYVVGEKVGEPCLSNISTRKYLLERLKSERAKALPGAIVTYGLACDDNSQWCECSDCAKLLTSLGNSSSDERASDLWWDFINWIAPRLLEGDLNARVTTLIYLNYRQPPKRIKPIVCDEERMAVIICPHGRCHLHSLNDPKCPTNPKYLKMISQWSEMGFRAHTFEYHCQLPGKGNYAFIEKPWVEDLKWYAENKVSHTSGGLWGVWGGYPRHKLLSKKPIYEFGAKSRWQIIWLSGYFEWDPSDDFETVRKRLLTVYYRAASEEMLEYHALLEKAIFDANICMSYGSSALPFTVAARTPGLLDKAKALLRAAESKAEGDIELMRRITRDRQSLVRDWESASNIAAGQKAKRIFRATSNIKIDGVLDEPSWASAQTSDDYRWQKTYNVDDPQNEPYRPHTLHKLQYDNDNLYVAFVCEKAGGKVMHHPGNNDIWDSMLGSHLEFCVMSPQLNGLYYHISITHSGKVYSALTTNPTLRNLDKKLDFTYVLKDEKDRWVVEMAIPFAGINVPKDGDVWKFSAMRQAVGPDGSMVTGLSTGFPLHWIDRWEPISFGTPGSLCANGSFEYGRICPKEGSLEGRYWKFLSERVPGNWQFHCNNGGIAKWVESGAADGKAFLRIGPGNKHGGPEFVLTSTFPLYPPATQKLLVSFYARGEGRITLYSFAVKKLIPVDVELSSPSEWKKYEVEVPLNGTHPLSLVFRFLAPGGNDIDIDDVTILPQ